MNKNLKRKSRGKPELKYYLIVCEGVKTEPNYFKHYNNGKVYACSIKVEGGGCDPVNLVKVSLQHMKNGDYDEVWVVFDRDDFSAGTLNRAFKMAKENNVNVAFSNQSFELWFLLHFEFLSVNIPRADYIRKLTSILRDKRLIKQHESYGKENTAMFGVLDAYQETAIKHAIQLEEYHDRLGNGVHDYSERAP